MELLRISFIFYCISTFSGFLPLIVGKKKVDIIWYYVFLSFFLDVFMFGLKMSGIEDQSLGRFKVAEITDLSGNCFMLAEFFLISFFYKPIIFKSKSIFTAVIIIVPLIFAIPFFQDISNIWKLNFEYGSLFSAVYIIYSIACFYDLIKRPQTAYLERSPVFWVNTALLIYGSGTPLFFLFNDLLRNNIANTKILWGIYFHLLIASKNLILTLYFYLRPRSGSF